MYFFAYILCYTFKILGVYICSEHDDDHTGDNAGDTGSIDAEAEEEEDSTNESQGVKANSICREWSKLKPSSQWPR